MFVLYGLALLARGLAASVLGLNYPLDNDEPEYYYPAIHIAGGDGYRKVPQQSPDDVAYLTAYRMPGPSLILACGLGILGPGFGVARLISAAFGALAAPLMYLLARRIAPPQAAVLAGLACAFYPSYAYFSLRIFSEPFFIPFVLLALLTTLWAIDSGPTWPSAIAGLCWGVVVMVRPHGLPIAGLIAAYLVFRKRRLSAIFLMAGVAAFLVPWLIRNQVALGHPVLLATEAGETLFGANNPYVLDDPGLHGMWISPLKITEYANRLRPIRDEVERNRVQTRIALDFLGRHPESIPLLVYYKLARWLTPVTVSSGLIRLLVLASYGTLLVLLAAGLLLRAFESSAALHLVLLCTVVFLAIAAVYWGGLTRGRLPLEILWIPWGATAAWDLVLRLRHRLAARASDGVPLT